VTAPNLLRLNRAFGTLCYTLSPKGAAKLFPPLTLTLNETALSTVE